MTLQHINQKAIKVKVINNKVKMAIQSLENNRFSAYDTIEVEMMKRSSNSTTAKLTDIINTTIVH